jgi:hypothetical protein
METFLNSTDRRNRLGVSGRSVVGLAVLALALPFASWVTTARTPAGTVEVHEIDEAADAAASLSTRDGERLRAADLVALTEVDANPAH